MKFDLLKGGQEIKLAIHLPLFCLFRAYFFASVNFGDGFFHFQDNKLSLKQVPGHNHENTIFQPGECSFMVLCATENEKVLGQDVEKNISQSH